MARQTAAASKRRTARRTSATTGVGRSRAEVVQDALYRIAEAASAAHDMGEFYATIHGIVRELTYAENFYIALYDDERKTINFPYFVNQVDTDIPDPSAWAPFGSHFANESTAIVLRTGQTQHSPIERYRELLDAGEIAAVGAPGEDWLGVPLKVDGRTIGALVVLTYEKGLRYTDADVELVEFVAQHIGVALARARAIEETRERNAELAVINEIGQALAAQLDFDAIVELVGQRVSQIFATDTVTISFYDEASGMISVAYALDAGRRSYLPDRPFGQGLFSIIIRDKRPLLFGRASDADAAGAIWFGTRTESFVGVPITAGERVIGVVSVDDVRPFHFTDADQRLLSTIATSMGVALENARLFAETKRLLAETDQRAAELAVINAVQEGLAAELDMGAMYELVGEKVRQIFAADSIGLGIVDEIARTIAYPYAVLYGERSHEEPLVLGEGLSSIVVSTARPLRIGRLEEAMRLGGRAHDDERNESWLGVPIAAGGLVLGLIVLESEEPASFDEADERLLSTIASSLGTALENARLFDETRQRNAELALINEIGGALAAQLEFDVIVELVGERVRSIFDVRSIYVAMYDETTNLMTFPYDIDEGERFDRGAFELGPGITSTVITTGRALRLSTVEEQVAAGAVQIGGSDTQSWLGVPIPAGSRVIGVVALESLWPHAFSEADERLLSTLAASMGVALENARLFGETKRLLAQTDQRAAELAVINAVQEGLVAELDMAAMYELVGLKVGEIFAADTLYIGVVDEANATIRFPYEVEKGERYHTEPIPIGAGLTSRVVATGRPLRTGSHEEAARLGAIVVGTEVTESWLGVPIPAGDRVLGIIALEGGQRDAFSESQERLLTTLAVTLGVALENARLFAEIRQRNAELAVINEIGLALAKQLDLDAITELVGERVRTMFDARTIAISLYDAATGLTTTNYAVEEGERFYSEPMTLGEGLTSIVIKTGRPLITGTLKESEALGSVYIGGLHNESWLGVPILAGERVIGVVNIENLQQHAYDEADARLLGTLAASMGVALENARLFDETRRLLSETDQRAAELAVITSVQEGLAAELEMQAMYDLVGDKIRDIFDAQVVDIAIYDRVTNEMRFTYGIERGVRLEPLSMPLIGPRRHVVETRAPLLINENAMERVVELGQPGAVVGEMARSAVWAPLIAGDEVRGVISIQNLDREHAFSETDVRLLSTLAASLSVSLENARLFDATRRLLVETDERAKELAIINAVQEGLAAELDMAAMYELVGDKIQEVFDAQVVDISVVDRKAGLIRFRYTIERGVRFPDEPIGIIGFRRHVIETGEPLMIEEAFAEKAAEYGQPAILAGEMPKSAAFVPLTAGGETIGVI